MKLERSAERLWKNYLSLMQKYDDVAEESTPNKKIPFVPRKELAAF